VQVVGDDSRGAFVRLAEQRAGVAVLARPLQPDEEAAMGPGLLQTCRLATDALAIVVHPATGVDSLDLRQLAAVLSGVVDSWERVGGASLPVIRVLRDRNSGTYEQLRQQVLSGGDFGPGTACRSSREVVERVASTPGAVGCVGLAWVGDPRVVAVRLAAADQPAVRPTPAAVFQQRYPLRRPWVVCHWGGQDADLAAGFVAFLTSPRGQTVVEREGLVPDQVPPRSIELTRR
jgi:phosphate transport system substrate-binding protein